LIQQEINKQTWACKLIVARTEEEKYSALAVKKTEKLRNNLFLGQ